MAMTNINSRRDYLVKVKRQYRDIQKKGSRKQLTNLIDNATETTGYHRKHIITLLNGTDSIRLKESNLRNRGRKKIYDSREFIDSLKLCWRASNYIYAERLQPLLPELIEKLIKPIEAISRN